MNKFLFISVIFVVISGYAFLSCKEKSVASEQAVSQTVLAQIDSFATLCKMFKAEAESGLGDEKKLQQLFLQARLAYKKFEWAAEYFVPATSRFVNGPPAEEVETYNHQVFEPAGLQVIEGLLYPKYNKRQKHDLVQQLETLQSNCVKYKNYFANIGIFNWQIFDAAKLEVFRIVTLGITGFDDPLSQNSMIESSVSVESLRKVIAYYIDKGDTEDLMEKFSAATRYLAGNTDFNSFNRMEFITVYSDPITTGLTHLENKLKIHVITYNRLLNQDAKTLFDSNAFNVNAYAPDQSSFATADKVALGKMLFSDARLSGTGKRSCQSCHQPEKAFSDGLVKNTIIGLNTLLKRNTPTLLNSALQPSLFYDLRVNRLEEQSLSVMRSKEEMHGSMQVSVKSLWQDETYRQMFSKAFPVKNRTGIDTMEVVNAISSYVRSLVSLNSRFDEYMRGNKKALNVQEIDGFNLFMGKGKCATCHYMPLFNGTFPPRFIKTEAEVIGVPLSLEKNEIDSDMGRFDVIKIESFKHAFKTPTVRNAARTAPYMHNGVFTTLQQVMDFYNKGGGVGLGIKVDNQTLPFDELHLSEKEINDVIAFIKSLDSR